MCLYESMFENIGVMGTEGSYMYVCILIHVNVISSVRVCNIRVQLQLGETTDQLNEWFQPE